MLLLKLTPLVNNSAIRMSRAVDAYRYVLAEPVVTPPGAKYTYSSGATELLGAVLHQATGHRLDELARTVLFAPLGIDEFEWLRNADGTTAASWGLRLRPRDMAKLGQLVLAHGLWQGQQLVPRAYLDDATAPQIQGAGPLLLWLPDVAGALAGAPTRDHVGGRGRPRRPTDHRDSRSGPRRRADRRAVYE